ncbi:(E2-independent) E3 ubiquitin-conjugating enzyme FATS [Pogoniulus pusillus]|uniref:(E2-independent) E3 ubiquitin-conjugating enzyme FATS n=1 Tax=Pogoniulus pusillus TaxID=488313 RepID=UPI0030B9851A
MNYSCPCKPELADRGFPCSHCNKWWLVRLCSGRQTSPRMSPASSAMPAGEGQAPCLRCARHSRLEFQVKPHAKCAQGTQCFVTQMYLSINCSSWKKTGSFGVTQRPWGTDGQRTYTGLQCQSAAERKSSSPQESLSSQSTALIFPIVTPQMIGEKKSKLSWPALPVQPTFPQPSANHMKQSLASHGSVNTNRAFKILPSRLEIQVSLDNATSPSDSPLAEEQQCQNQQKGFAFITVTARRVAAGSSHPACGPGAVQETNTTSPNSSQVPAALCCCLPPNHAHQRDDSSLKISESCSQPAQRHFFDPGNKESSLSLQSSKGREEVPPAFTSRVHFQVSQHCPNTIYYLDKSLNVCIDQPGIKRQRTYRSALSFNINCSSSRLTADGVDGIANGEPKEKIHQTKFLGENKTPLRSKLSADLTGNNAVNKTKSNEGYSASKYPLQRHLDSDLPAIVDVPRRPNSIAMEKHHANKQSGSYHTAFSLQLPNSSNEADTASRKSVAATTDGSLKTRDPSKGTSKCKEFQAQCILQPKTFLSRSMCNIKASSRILLEENVHEQNQLLKSNYEFCASSDKLKECEVEEDKWDGAHWVALSKAYLLDVPHKKNDPHTRPETRILLEKTPPAPWTLREALEMHNPQFISRSQERLKRLEHMVQLRKAQQSNAPASNQGGLLARKLSSASSSSKKKQYTIPHPLSDNLFKPKERFIPEKEMHMRSKRIYDNLPEVKKKQEEKQKRIIIQSNRLRVEMFKKQLLDQLLQRSTE